VLDAFARVHALWWDHPALGEIDRLPDEDSMQAYVASVHARLAGFMDCWGVILVVWQRGSTTVCSRRYPVYVRESPAAAASR
jgi:hypothetical protein